MKRLRIVLFLLATIVVLSACSGGAEASNTTSFSAIGPADFPSTVGGGFPIAQVADGSGGSADVGQPAPNFAFVWEDGRGADLASLRGRPVIVNFWATWCGPCRAEMPELVAMHRSNPALVVLEVNTQERLEVIRPFTEEFGMTMPVLVDEAGAVRILYGVRAMPTTLFIDAEGLISARWAGLLTGDQLAQFVTQLQTP
ncbi:MAG: TlpA family protein disulfide reductase [Chloroflexi bacterium]|nr:TlpA family protein disulfide reductase [Chloroflexota bacterium]